MPAVDPHDATAVAAAVAAWASEHFGGPVAVSGTPAPVAGGFDSYIHALDLAGAVLPDEWRGPLVVRVLPAADRIDQAHREAAVQQWADARGFPVPRVLAVLDADEVLGFPSQVMERVPGSTMLAAVAARPWRAPALLGRLADLAADLHALPADGWPGLDARTDLVDRRLSLPRRAVERLDVPELAAALARAEAVAVDAIGDERSVCHGDFHPLNVLVDGDRTWVIDWTDAALGPREADVARTALLLSVAAVAASGRVERGALRMVGPLLARRYRRAYARRAPVDPQLIARWEVLHLVHAWAQIEMLGAGEFAGESSADGRAIPDSIVRLLRRRLVRALSDVGSSPGG